MADTDDPEKAYGEMAVRCVLADGHWRHLPWPAYETTARMMAERGDLEAAESIGRAVYRLKL
ncbi:hypothetical protein [Albibacillus kandeliae]|uniref:hypothetical protein n=1 Tax=Albibacillus kandeliae TaxID=2174228 RepID=UPI000D68C77E|nr:hypothetical protein [Albibacillus kandeliae]